MDFDQWAHHNRIKSSEHANIDNNHRYANLDRDLFLYSVDSPSLEGDLAKEVQNSNEN